MIIQTSCHCGATSPLIPASHPFVHPFQHSLLNVTLLPQYSHMGTEFTLFIPNKLHIYNAGSMKTCAILWCPAPNSEKPWALKHSLIKYKYELFCDYISHFSTVLFAFNQRKELVCFTHDWLQTHNVRSSFFPLLVCDLHSNSVV